MAVTYFKRFRMEIDLERNALPRMGPPPGYRFVAWDPSLVELFGETKYRSFRGEIDSAVFPCLGDPLGCERLMADISNRAGFLPEATWLIAHDRDDGEPVDYCGTIQGIRDRSGFGAVQNVGVTPMHRDQGLGTCLIAQALEGFSSVGLRRGYLEVTARNKAAVRLYKRLGFSKVRTIYKAVEVPAPAAW